VPLEQTNLNSFTNNQFPVNLRTRTKMRTAFYICVFLLLLMTMLTKLSIQERIFKWRFLRFPKLKLEEKISTNKKNYIQKIREEKTERPN
jgi:hypothetical protein